MKPSPVSAKCSNRQKALEFSKNSVIKLVRTRTPSQVGVLFYFNLREYMMLCLLL